MPSDAENSLLAGLACAAVEPGLRAVLILDASPDSVRGAFFAMQRLLQSAGETEIETVTLGPSDTEDDLWGALSLETDRRGARLRNRPGRLAPDPKRGDRLKLVVIRDIAMISLAAQRACVALVSSETGTLQRNGQNLTWTTRYCWIAGCARARVGELSPHLLDRFGLRLSAPRQIDSDRARLAELSRRIAGDVSPSEPKDLVKLEEDVRRASARNAGLDPEAIPVLFGFLQKGDSPRRELTLARLSVALAKLRGANSATDADVTAAAHVIGLRAASPRPAPAQEDPSTTPPGARDVPAEAATPPKAAAAAAMTNTQPETVETPVAQDTSIIEPTAETTLEGAAIETSPYPEDVAAIERQRDPLRLPFTRGGNIGSDRGVIVGTQTAPALRDIAWVSTILEAAKFQRVRRAMTKARSARLILLRSDLRSWRRAPEPQDSLVLMIDHTCLASSDWESSLIPHLQWAYAQRARVTLINAGGQGATPDDGLRAASIQGRNLLAPAIRKGFECEPGSATPLAHGLDLAVRALRQYLQTGRNRMETSRLVVVSDGRGNVPLEASWQGKITYPAGTKGIEDSFRIAAEVPTLHTVDAFLLYPSLSAYRPRLGDNTEKGKS